MRQVTLASVLAIVLVCGSIHIASALRCGNKIVSPGDNQWLVQDVCGEPTSMAEHHEIITKHGYDAQRGIYKDYTTYITYEIWRYKFGRGRLAHILIFRDHTLVDVVTEKRYRYYWKDKKGY